VWNSAILGTKHESIGELLAIDNLRAELDAHIYAHLFGQIPGVNLA